MKVYLYISDDVAVYLSGILSNPNGYDGNDLIIYYSNQPTVGLDLMVSMSLDQFVYLQDLGILQQQQLLVN